MYSIFLNLATGAARPVLLPGRRPAKGTQVGARVAALRPLHGVRHAPGGDFALFPYPVLPHFNQC